MLRVCKFLRFSFLVRPSNPRLRAKWVYEFAHSRQLNAANLFRRRKFGVVLISLESSRIFWSSHLCAFITDVQLMNV